MKTFKCNFGKGVSCELQVTDAPPEKGSSHILACEWSGERTLKHLRPYVAWMNTVNKTLADEWGVKLLHVFQTSSTQVEMWSYEPGKAPKLIKET